MEHFLKDDLLVVCATLRELYRRITSGQLSEEEKTTSTTGLASLLNKCIHVAISQPERPVFKSEAFEDLLAVLWQLTWVLSKQGSQSDALLPRMQKLQENLPALDPVAYETLAAEAILETLSSFGISVEWVDQFGELSESVRQMLLRVDEQVYKFGGLERLRSSDRLSRLLLVFFDCYFGFQQRQDQAENDPYLRQVRECWQRRYRKYRSYRVTNKKILCAYSAGVDYSLRVTNTWLQTAIKRVASAEGKTPALLIREVSEFLQGIDSTLPSSNVPDSIKTPANVLKALLGYIKVTGSEADWTSKIDINNPIVDEAWDIIDLMSGLFKDLGCVPALGGAAVTGANALVKLEEPNITLLLPFVPASLRTLLDDKLDLLWYDGSPPALVRRKPSAFETTHHPEIRNFVLEFSAGSPIIYCTACGAAVLPHKTDRLIIRNRFAYYLPNGQIDRATTEARSTQLNVQGLFGFDSRIAAASLHKIPIDLARTAAEQRYDIFFVAGLQSLDRSVRNETLQALEVFRDQGTCIHVEISGDKNLDWLVEDVARCVSSVGVGEELAALFAAAEERHLNSLADAEKQLVEAQRLKHLDTDMQGRPRGYRDLMFALEVTRFLKLERLYVHGVDNDIIIRQGNLSEDERGREIQGDLIAKWVVLRKLMARGQILSNQDRDSMTQVKEEAMAALVETAAALYERYGGKPSTRLELNGIYIPFYDRTIMLVPVRWVYGKVQDQLRVIGAGDTSSLIDAVQVLAHS